LKRVKVIIDACPTVSQRRIEAFIHAVSAYYHYWDDPEGKPYELRNPIMMIDYRREGPAYGKIRKFSCHQAGIRTAEEHVKRYCMGHPEEDISSLLKFCGVRVKKQQEDALDFMSRCANSTLTLQTKLVWFTQNG